MTVVRRVLVALSLLALGVSPGLAQDQGSRLRAQQDTLARLRREREQLERRAAELQSTVHDLSEEVSNLNRRAEATARIVHALDSQLEMINGEVAGATRDVSITQRDLAQKKVALHDRLVDIYKRGPLFTTQVLLSARSFGELVARYKYLHLLALHDRALVRRVEQLHVQVKKDQDRLVALQNAVEQNRDDKAREEAQLRELEQDRGANLARTQREVQLTEARLAKIRATESQLTNTITIFDTERRRAEAARPTVARSGSTIKTSDYGRLDWPVDGPLVYTFGKAQTASNTTIRWNGVGIKANVGTSVTAVAAGKVVSAAPLGTYGLTVIIDHGGGDYSIYGSLSRADVRQGQQVAKGQQIGGVGISDPEYPPHLHFEIRHGGADGRPASVDPATWLRDQR
ncbi:MAG TPA: peptidoglycan DD-metalloendopeptidase family protein [Gemmatimonadaceae bacterium]|jgi:septal ring factor EnvC (AmiA/AmiB activator)|nr:peptidoglycan DD-metalloendopeptidase family protein [Gemmatimonadaceae bacterium]